ILKETEKSGVYRLDGVGPVGPAIIAKQCLQKTAVVERTIYERVLPHLPLPRLNYYGFVEEPGGDFGWLFMENAGHKKYSPRLKKHRQIAGRWLALLHTSAVLLGTVPPLPERGPNHYREHLRSARDALRACVGDPALTTEDLSVLEDILAHCDFLEGRWS